MNNQLLFIFLLFLVSCDNTKTDRLTSRNLKRKNQNEIPSNKIGVSSSERSKRGSEKDIINFYRQDGVLYVPATVNKILRVNFILDTGASDVSISPGYVLALLESGTLNDDDYIGTESYQLADGSIIESSQINIKEIQIGNVKLENVKASISGNLGSPLLLGQSFLNKFGIVQINYRKNYITFK